MRQIRNFLLLGVLSTLVDYAVYSLLLMVGVDFVTAIIVGYGTGLWVNYYIARHYIFTSGTKVNSVRTEFVAVVLIAFAGALLNIAIVKLLSYSLWQIDPMLSRVVAIGIVFFWNYFARKRFIYH